MPRMLPARPDGDAPDSERKVFAAFERHLPRDWTVFHSRRLVLPRQGDAALERELDFLVIDPARGFLGLEVKGGVEIWTQFGRLVFRKRSSPSHQVAGCAGAAGDARARGIAEGADRVARVWLGRLARLMRSVR
jgi:hypothetical protein